MLAPDDLHGTLFYGDNLAVLREQIPDACVDLIYLDPPFNSNAGYNVLFRDESGRASGEQIEAFDDTWHWGADSEDALAALLSGADSARTHDRGGGGSHLARSARRIVRAQSTHRLPRNDGDPPGRAAPRAQTRRLNLSALRPHRRALPADADGRSLRR